MKKHRRQSTIIMDHRDRINRTSLTRWDCSSLSSSSCSLYLYLAHASIGDVANSYVVNLATYLLVATFQQKQLLLLIATYRWLVMGLIKMDHSFRKKQRIFHHSVSKILMFCYFLKNFVPNISFFIFIYLTTLNFRLKKLNLR